MKLENTLLKQPVRTMSEQFMIPFPLKFVTALSLFAVVMTAHCQTAMAQEHFIGEGQAVNRVIKLRSPSAQNPSLTKRMVETTSRGDHLDRNTRPVANPNQIQFEKIDAPLALRQQSQPVLSNAVPVTPNKSLRPMDQGQFASATKAGTKASLRSNPQVSESRQDTTAETITIRNNMVSTKIRSPKTVNVNQSAQLLINLRNLSDETIVNVTLIARIPEHAKFVSATPRPTRIDGQVYEFDLPTIEGDQTTQINLNVVPTQKAPLEIETELRVVNHQKTVVGVQQPELMMKISGPVQATTGKPVTHLLTIINVGDGAATDVLLTTTYPDGLKPTQIPEAKRISRIRPGATLEIPLESRALTAGQGELKVVATTSNTKPQEASLNVHRHQPELRLSAVGPKLNFLQRDGIYSIDVENTGEVDVTNVRVSLAVPSGMKVTTISRPADVDAERGVLSWSFDTLAAKSNEKIQLKATATEEGQQVCTILINSTETLEKEFRLATEITSRADLSVQIKSLTGPVQVGAKAEFLIEVENRGSRQAKDISVLVNLPDSLMLVRENPNSDENQNALTFREPLVAPGQKVTFKFVAVGVAKGDHVVRSTLEVAGSERKVISENSVYVYEVAEARVSESLSPVVPR